MSEPPPIRILSGSPTEDETAAIAAVFATLMLERAAAVLPLPSGPARSEWDRTRRVLRTPVQTENNWRDR